MSTADAPERTPPPLTGGAPRVLILHAPYYADVVGGMVAGAREALGPFGATLEEAEVAGAFELPAALRMAIRSGAHDGYLLFGCVVRGETDHYDHICRETFRGVMDLSMETGAPMGFGLLTVDTISQAVARSRPDRHNKGREAAVALLFQVALSRRFGTAA